MRRIESVGEPALARLTPGVEGRVHTSYRGAVNILLPVGLVSIVPRSAGRGPLNLVVGEWRAEDRGLGFEEGQRVVIRDKVVAVGKDVLSFADAHVYNPHPISRLLPTDKIRRNVNRALGLIGSEGRLEGLGGLVQMLGGSTADTSSDRSAFMSAALHRSARLARALESRDVGEISMAGKGLLGLGIGLTPSGDDLLCGVFVAIVLGSRSGFEIPRGLQPIFAEIASSHGRTTLLGREFLLQASLGKANEKVIDFVSALYASDVDVMVKSLKALLAMGETSGTDTALGVIVGAKSSLGWARRKLA
ncbi:MAG TPA: DUF2877 domain-containing protein [Nitrososphaerales archaeon]|nr:DUF2877 domain-containing protein [Nitrososphaerales archaeon]